MSLPSSHVRSGVRPWNSPKYTTLLPEGAPAVEVRVTDISEDTYRSTLYTVPTKAAEALQTKFSAKTGIRIISIFSDRTIEPLNLTPSLMELLFSQYDVPHGFADIISSFGEEPNIAEGRCNNATLHFDKLNRGEIAYEIRYVESNLRGGHNPWSLRHTGVFHRARAAGEADVMIVLHPVRKPPFEAIICGMDKDHTMRRSISADPFLLHELLFGCYFDNWRWYMRDLGERFRKENSYAMVTKPDKTEPNSTFIRVQELRNTNDLVLFARACCAGNRDLVGKLLELRLGSLSNTAALKAHSSKLSGYMESADVLQSRIQNLIDLVGYTLTLHNQLESAKVEKELRDLTEGLKNLTQDTVDDSATVKIITFVSAVYLPGSFIATLLGMNLFTFEDTTKKLKVSPDFWIFIAAWLPLTLITAGSYMYIKAKSKREATKRGFSCQKRGSSYSTMV